MLYRLLVEWHSWRRNTPGLTRLCDTGWQTQVFPQLLSYLCILLQMNEISTQNYTVHCVLTRKRYVRCVQYSMHCSTKLTGFMVPYAVIRRVLKVDQIVLCGLPELPVGDGEARPVAVHHHLSGAAVLLAQVVARLSEVAHGQPASPNVAGTTHAMAFTFQSHETFHCLDNVGKRKYLDLGGPYYEQVTYHGNCVFFVNGWSWVTDQCKSY